MNDEKVSNILGWAFWHQKTDEERKPKKTAHNLLPPSTYDELIYMKAARGDYQTFKEMWETLQPFEVYRFYAIQNSADVCEYDEDFRSDGTGADQMYSG